MTRTGDRNVSVSCRKCYDVGHLIEVDHRNNTSKQIPCDCSLMPEPEALKACPFCGEMPALQPRNPKEEGNAWGAVYCDNPKCVANPRVRDGESVADERGTDAYQAIAIRRWNTRPAEDRKADEGVDWARANADSVLRFENQKLTTERDALRAQIEELEGNLRYTEDAFDDRLRAYHDLSAQIERLTSDEAVEAALFKLAYVNRCTTKAAITEALRVAGEGATEPSDCPNPLTSDL
jgi:hypothetical protein